MEPYSEHDDVEKLKNWWKSYGNSLIFGILLGVGILFGNKYWDQYKTDQSAAASDLYEELLVNINLNKAAEIKRAGGKIISDYKSTPYSGMAALLLARVSYQKNDIVSAQSQLQWAIDNATVEAVRHIARLRLARIMMEQKKTDEANRLVSSVNKQDMAGYKMEYFEVLGDIYMLKGNANAAKQAYQNALASATKQDGYRQILSMKLDNASRVPE